VSYTIKLSNSATLTTISDGSIDNTSSLTLIGRNYAGYGTAINENFVYLLENFSNSGSPANPLTGQLWYDSTNQVIKVYNTTTGAWKPVGGSVVSPTAPSTPASGDLWFNNTSYQQLNVWNGTNWAVIGPPNVPGAGQTGAFPVFVNGTDGTPRLVLELQVSGVPYAILSTTGFTPATTGLQANLAPFVSSVPGYASGIRAGLNFYPGGSQALGLNTQDVSATPSTLVQRGSDGSANVTVLTASQTVTASSIVGTTSVTAPTVTATASVVAPTITGNVVATTVTATTVNASTIGFNSGTSLVGTLNTAAQPYVTSLGNLTALSVAGTTNLYGSAYYNGAQIATVGGASNSTYIDGQPIGGNVPSTGNFTTITTAGLQAQAIGNVAPGTAVFTTANITTANITNHTGTSVSVTGNISGNIGIFNSISVGGGGSSSGNLSVAYVTVSGGLVPSTANGVNIGSTTKWFNNIYGTAIHSLYADLAERFESDAEYPAGTVVELGGAAEITKVVAELSDKVFGVISTNAAYLMNSKAGTDTTHPPIAMSGRVPVRVVGSIAKGDRLVSAGNGRARAGKPEELTPWNVIGRSLVDKTDPGESIIEAIVKINS